MDWQLFLHVLVGSAPQVMVVVGHAQASKSPQQVPLVLQSLAQLQPPPVPVPPHLPLQLDMPGSCPHPAPVGVCVHAPVAGSHASVVLALPSSQLIGACVQPLVSKQVSVVHGLLSEQFWLALPWHAPSLQTSPVVHAKPSLHAVPVGYAQPCAEQVPLPQVLPLLHALPKAEKLLPFAVHAKNWLFAHVPVPALQTSAWHT